MESNQSLTEAINKSGFESIDFIILAAYVILLVSLGLFLSRERDGMRKSTKDYFLAGNTLTWWAVGASLVAANISTEHFIGMAGTGFADGLAITAYEIMASIALLVVAKFLLPVMIDRKLFTIPQFLYERYNSGVGLAFSIFFLFVFVFVNITSVAWLGGIAVEQILGLQGLPAEILGVSISSRIIIVLAFFIIAGVYSIYGGMASIAWIDVIQIVFIFGGGLIAIVSHLNYIAGDDGNILEGLNKMYTFLTSGDSYQDTHFHMIIRESHNASGYINMPGIATIVGALWLTNFGYWGFNQFIVQKGLAAQSTRDARKGYVFAAILKLVVPFITILPGICAYYIVKNPDQFYDLQGTINVSDEAYPWLIHNFTPTGVKGLSFVAICAAVISSLASLFNSTSSIFTMDIYKKHINPDANDKTLVNIGRLVSVVALILAAITVQPLLGDLDQAFQYIQEYTGFLYPGIIVVFTLGMLWKRASTKAAMWTAIITIPLAVIFKVTMPQVPFLFRSGYVFMIIVAFFFLVSYLDNKFVSVELPSDASCSKMIKWAKTLGATGILTVIIAITVVVMDDSTTWTAYLNDIGFESLAFFGVMLGCNSVWLYSNAKDKKASPKALPINLRLFKTAPQFTYYAIGVSAVTLILYVLFW